MESAGNTSSSLDSEVYSELRGLFTNEEKLYGIPKAELFERLIDSSLGHSALLPLEDMEETIRLLTASIARLAAEGAISTSQGVAPRTIIIILLGRGKR